MNDATAHPAPGQDDRAIELTGFEILTLLSLGTDDPGAEGTRRALHLPEIAKDSPLLSAGISSLVVRRLAVPNEGQRQLTPQGKVLALTAVMNQATEWIEASGGAGESANAAVLLRSPAGSALIEPKPYGIWQALPLPGDRALTDLAADYVKAAFTHTPERPFAGTVRLLESSGTTTRAAAIRVDEKNTWEFTSGTPDAMPEPVVIAADPTFQVVAKGLAA
ncbi:hypothetical protein [Myceligenerans salitolerans]|uniref:Uncharacterized protein n=1 Tax=Myceligenerans salitolerans TaxID=1230528 RepID=A0ABS3ICF5_9MICO|nr:hypothetical protein [Myceligenerans salitolerans]MBO0610644.1 hypothetical protein [Myceligenerans salitolerans]